MTAEPGTDQILTELNQVLRSHRATLRVCRGQLYLDQVREHPETQRVERRMERVGRVSDWVALL